MRDPDEPFLYFGGRGSVLIPGPLYHNGPFMWATGGAFKGNTVSITKRFDAEQTLQLIEAQRVDTIYLVPTRMQRIWNLPYDVRAKYDVSSLKTLWHLAAPCPAWLCPAWLNEAYIGRLGADVIWELSDRQTDMILSGGANTYPAEVEAAIDAFPGVRCCAVIGLPHDDLGNYVYAIVDAPGSVVSKDALLAPLAERLARYKLPRTIEFVTEALRDDAGKVRRKSLRAERMPKG